MKKRIISAIIMLIIVIPLLVIGGFPYSLAVGLIACMAYKEIVDLRHDKLNEYPNIMKYLGLICTLSLVYYSSKYVTLFGVSYKLICGIILTLCIPVLFYKNRYKVSDAFHLLADVLFLGIGFNLLITVYNYGKAYFILLILITILTDTFALFGGKLVGKHKFTNISPNKTIEGSIIGTLVATFISTMYYVNVINTSTNILSIVLVIVFLSLVGQCGDLFFSAIKRECGKKDFSNLIPGHGGILDRLDSIIFVLFAFMLIINFI